MGFNFTKNDIAGDTAEGLLIEQGDRLQNALLYEIQAKAGHPPTTSIHWVKCENLPGIYEWLTLVAVYGPAFANRSFARLGLKVVPLGDGEIDEGEFLKTQAVLLEDVAELLRERAGAA